MEYTSGLQIEILLITALQFQRIVPHACPLREKAQIVILLKKLYPMVIWQPLLLVCEVYRFHEGHTSQHCEGPISIIQLLQIISFAQHDGGTTDIKIW